MAWWCLVIYALLVYERGGSYPNPQQEYIIYVCLCCNTRSSICKCMLGIAGFTNLYGPYSFDLLHCCATRFSITFVVVLLIYDVFRSFSVALSKIHEHYMPLLSSPIPLYSTVCISLLLRDQNHYKYMDSYTKDGL